MRPAEASQPESKPDGTKVENASGFTEMLSGLLETLDGLPAVRPDSHVDADDERRAAPVERPAIAFAQPASDSEEEAARGEDVYATITLDFFEAEAGARSVIYFRATDTCPECGASGSRTIGERCKNCDGSGQVETERRLHVCTPPGLEDGARIRISGQGCAALGTGLPGDLLLDVHVLPLARDSRLVRYAALAGALVAFALLVYVLFWYR